MKLSVSLAEADVEFLDAFAGAHALGSRSAAVQRAVQALRALELPDAYADAWEGWEANGDAARWEPTAGDGV